MTCMMGFLFSSGMVFYNTNGKGWIDLRIRKILNRDVSQGNEHYRFKRFCLPFESVFDLITFLVDVVGHYDNDSHTPNLLTPGYFLA